MLKSIIEKAKKFAGKDKYMLITIIFWTITLAVIVNIVKDTVKEMCEEYDCSKVDFEKLIFEFDECGVSEFWVGVRLLRGKYDLEELASDNEGYIDESRKAC